MINDRNNNIDNNVNHYNKVFDRIQVDDCVVVQEIEPYYELNKYIFTLPLLINHENHSKNQTSNITS